MPDAVVNPGTAVTISPAIPTGTTKTCDIAYDKSSPDKLGVTLEHRAADGSLKSYHYLEVGNDASFILSPGDYVTASDNDTNNGQGDKENPILLVNTHS